MEDNTLQLLEESGISENSIVALAQALSEIESYIPTNYVNDDSPDLDADNLNHAEQGIKRVTDALNLAIDTINSQSDTIAQLNSDLTDIENSLSPTKTVLQITFINSSSGTGNAYYIKIGQMIYISVDITFQELSSNNSQFTLNLPQLMSEFEIDLKKDDKIAWATITATGTINLWSNYGPGRYAGSCVAFIQ